MRRFPLVLCVFSVLVFSSAFIAAQQSSVVPRISAPVDDSVLTTLRGGVPGHARAEFDIGRAPASDTLTSVRLVLSRTPQQEAALEKFMAEQLDPASPNYHKWLTPQQFGQLYGPADADITTLVTWLESQGFTVEPVAPGRTSIAFSGTVAQIEAVFHTEIHSFNDHGEQFLSNVSNPQIPSALATAVSGVAQLDTIKPRPASIHGQSGTFDAESKRLRPMLTIGSNPYGLYIVPGDAATIYDTPDSLNANFGSGTSYNGSGISIGIGGDATIQTSTVLNYRQKFIGDSNVPTVTNVTSDPATCTDATSTTCAQDEAYLDNEIAGGLAPGATIHFYTSANLSDAIEQAISDNTVDIFSLSFGECEAGMSTADNQAINGWWQQAAAQGIAVTVSSGDSGSAGCDNDNTEYDAVDGLQVSGFASTPYNIAVGGTDFIGLRSSFTAYVSINNTSSSSSSGPNTPSTYYRSALSYIPESTWNDSVTADGLLAENTAYVNSSTGKTNIVAGSGGASSCSTNSNTSTSTSITNCTSGTAKPAWQTGIGVPADGVRDIPDVSLMAGNGFDDAAWLVCTDDTSTSNGTTFTSNCANTTYEGQSTFVFTGFGGTSTSAPAFAGILALLEQSTGSRLGQAAQKLYALYNSAHASVVFHDTTVGNISVPCTSGAPNCSENAAGSYFLTGYDTGTGYDLATGLGSVDAAQLINYWNTTTGTATATVAVTPSATSITTTQSFSVTISVSGASSTPAGSVQIKAGTYISSYQTISSGTYTFTVPAGSMSPSNNTISATYSGDSTYAAATGSTTISVSKATPTLALSTPSSSAGGSETNVTVAVSVSGGGPPIPTGAVTLTATGGYSSGPCTLGAGFCSITIPMSSLPNGTVTLTASYNGDAYYNSALGSITITVHVYTPTISVSLPSNVTTSSTLQIPVTVNGVSSQPIPTGTIYVDGVGNETYGGILSNGAVTFSFAPGTFNSGTLNLTFTYRGDTYYQQVTQTAVLTVAKSPVTFTVVPISTSIQSNQPLTISGVLTGSVGAATATNYPTGTITISGGGYTSSAIGVSYNFNGTYSFTIPGDSLSAGTDTLIATYSGNALYNAATSSATVTVTQYTPLTPTVTVTPASSSVSTGESLSVPVTVTGTGATPTGTITLSGGGYTSTAQTLSSGSATVTIPANSLSVGTDTLTATYSGDLNYAGGTGIASVVVAASSYSLAGGTPPAISPGGSASSAVTVSTNSGYIGSVSLSCSLTSSPSGAQDAPTCSVSGSSIMLSSTTTSGTATVNFSTTAASAAVAGHVAGTSWLKSGAVTLAAMLFFFGIPARRRGWRAMLGVLVLMAAFGALSACGGGGGGSGGGGGGNSIPGTTAGSYTFTIASTGNPAVSPSPSTTVTLTVN